MENYSQLYKEMKSVHHECCIMINVVGWIDILHLRFLYNECRFQETLRFASMSDVDFCLINPISLVPYIDGQALMMGLRYCSREFTITQIQTMYFEPVRVDDWRGSSQVSVRGCPHLKTNEEVKSTVIEK